ncbi:MAG TPA: DUF5343 domain-containing protein [bacterium]|jgi:hypothetical protein|nr:DUF5343 domain-containing protein [bacterium]
MPKQVPYLNSYKNVGNLFAAIRTAKIPDVFSTNFLSDTIGLKSTYDRQMIAFLKALGFLDSSGRPTTSYSFLKNQQSAGPAIAEALKVAYAPLFEANEGAHGMQPSELKGLVAQVTGADEGVVGKIVGTLLAILKLADFSSAKKPVKPEQKLDEEEIRDKGEEVHQSKLRTEFHYNIQIHLPASASEETYLKIFSAIRATFK